jgi:hypothetical protein
MSLINDALKKAKQAQANAPVRESALQLRPAATDHPVRSGPSLVLPAIIVAVGLVGAALVWVAVSNQREDRKAGPVATSRPAVPPGPEPAAGPKPVEMIPASPHPTPVSQASTTPPATPATSSPEPEPPAVAGEPVATVSAAKPAPPKLDGIFFHPNKPTAIVNNKLVSPGSRIGDLTVLAITQSSVTLEGGGQTNVLSLSE